MKLHLGVIDVSYSGDEGAKTTGEVAEILEDKYHIMRVFLELNEQYIGDQIANSLAGSLESLAQGAPYNPQMLKPVLPKVAQKFQQFLDSRVMENILPSTQQIAAAAAGVSHRKKHPYAKKNKPRPAFIDTGLYRSAFRSWVD